MDRLKIDGLVALEGRELAKANGGWGPFFVPIPWHWFEKIRAVWAQNKKPPLTPIRGPH